MIDTIQRSKCCGCGACADICERDAIKMIEDPKGFIYPEIDSSICVNCGACERICALKCQKMKVIRFLEHMLFNIKIEKF